MSRVESDKYRLYTVTRRTERNRKERAGIICSIYNPGFGGFFAVSMHIMTKLLIWGNYFVGVGALAADWLAKIRIAFIEPLSTQAMCPYMKRFKSCRSVAAPYCLQKSVIAWTSSKCKFSLNEIICLFLKVTYVSCGRHRTHLYLWKAYYDPLACGLEPHLIFMWIYIYMHVFLSRITASNIHCEQNFEIKSDAFTISP